MIELLKEDLRIILGLLIVLCQLSLGMFCDRKMKLNLSFSWWRKNRWPLHE